MVPKKESLTVEFKSDLKKISDEIIFEVVVGFANTDGGELYIGVEDDGTITGVHKSHSDPLTLPAYIANNTVPPISVRCEILQTEPKVLKICICKSLNSIVATSSGKVFHRRIKADGTPENVVMYPFEYANRLSDLRLLDYTAMVVEQLDIQAISDNEIIKLKDLINLNQSESSLLSLSKEDLCKALGLVREENNTLHPTVCGLLMLSDKDTIARYVPTSKAQFVQLNGTSIAVNKDIDGSIISCVNELMRLIENNIHETEYSIGAYRISVPDYDLAALREAVVNAFCHRDYSKLGRINIKMCNEGIYISSPGSFIDGVSYKNLITVEPHGRNPLLADNLKRIGLAERTGRGIDRIYEGALKYGKQLPDFSLSNDSNVTVFFPKSNGDISYIEKLLNIKKKLGSELSIASLFVLNLIIKQTKVSFDEFTDSINLPASLITQCLNYLCDKNILACIGDKNKLYLLNIDEKLNNTKDESISIKNSSKDRLKAMIITLALKKEKITNSDIVDLTGVDTNKAYRLLTELVKEKKLSKSILGRYTTYQINKNDDK